MESISQQIPKEELPSPSLIPSQINNDNASVPSIPSSLTPVGPSDKLLSGSITTEVQSPQNDTNLSPAAQISVVGSSLPSVPPSGAFLGRGLVPPPMGIRPPGGSFPPGPGQFPPGPGRGAPLARVGPMQTGGSPFPPAPGQAPVGHGAPPAARGGTAKRGRRKSKYSDEEDEEEDQEEDLDMMEEEEEEEEEPEEEVDTNIYCICRKVYDPNLVMVACDKCDEWFHTKCVGLNALTAKRLVKFICPSCKDKFPEVYKEAEAQNKAAEDARLAKRKPKPVVTEEYDEQFDEFEDEEEEEQPAKKRRGRRQDSDEEAEEAAEVRCICTSKKEFGSMIQCDACSYWLHFRCVGVSSQNVPEKYTCDYCLKTRPLPDQKLTSLLSAANAEAGARGGRGRGGARGGRGRPSLPPGVPPPRPGGQMPPGMAARPGPPGMPAGMGRGFGPGMPFPGQQRPPGMPGTPQQFMPQGPRPGGPMAPGQHPILPGGPTARPPFPPQQTQQPPQMQQFPMGAMPPAPSGPVPPPSAVIQGSPIQAPPPPGSAQPPAQSPQQFPPGMPPMFPRMPNQPGQPPQVPFNPLMLAGMFNWPQLRPGMPMPPMPGAPGVGRPSFPPGPGVAPPTDAQAQIAAQIPKPTQDPSSTNDFFKKEGPEPPKENTSA